MNSIAIYLFFLTAFCAFRPSKYWPSELIGFSWLGGSWKAGLALMLGTIVSCCHYGLTVGLLFALCANMLFLSLVIFFANCNSALRLAVVALFHIFCLLGIILSF